jgi:hypothetical protein
MEYDTAQQEHIKRSVGPVTTAAGVGAALSGLIAWLLKQFAGIEVPPEVQGYLAIILVVVAGWAVRPRTKARRVAE